MLMQCFVIHLRIAEIHLNDIAMWVRGTTGSKAGCTDTDNVENECHGLRQAGSHPPQNLTNRPVAVNTSLSLFC